MSGSISADITSGVGDFEGGDDLLRAWVEGLTPDADLNVSEWADQYRMLASRASAEPGRYRTSRTPYMREIMDALSPNHTAQRVVFGCPVVEAYGMTEAALQMTSNPIAVGAQKPGSVGTATGPDVMLATKKTVTDTAGIIGEIVIRGRNVTIGYEANEKANAENFFPDPNGDGNWFRTGDCRASTPCPAASTTLAGL
jgi:acyl-CoA synthetase (AMP-forming)/AMP-acid ligase II